MIYRYYGLLLAIVTMASCTDLDEEFRSSLEEGDEISSSELLISAYETLNGPYQQGNRWAMQELSSDEAIAPTRGGDWDDNGRHRALHLHSWNADNDYLSGCFGQFGTTIYQASNVLRNNPTAGQAAEARFIRALALFDMLDLWGIAVYRENLDDFKEDPIILDAQQGIELILEELGAIINDLPDGGPAYVANQDAARVLMMKSYLNRGTFITPESPSFPAEDMNKVIEIADQIEGYSISGPGKYFDNFAPNNAEISTGNIFTLFNQEGGRGGSVGNTYNTIAHYNMDPGGWNGWATLGSFYDKFTEGDERLGFFYQYPAFNKPNPAEAKNVGFLIGQQYNLTTGEPLMARNPSSQPLEFTHDITLRTSGNTLETAGIRVLKYPYDYASSTGQKNNDWVVFRYADVLMMKAEAILRGGNGSMDEALSLVNEIRQNRNAPALTSIDLDEVLDERGREFYWEGWRRQDLIRFGKFLGTWETKPDPGDPKELRYAIPSQQLAVNPNLEQNPGY